LNVQTEKKNESDKIVALIFNVETDTRNRVRLWAIVGVIVW